MSDRGSFASRFGIDEGIDAAEQHVGEAQAALGGASSAWLLSDHQGASDSPLRGYVYWRSTDTRRQISRLTDKEIHRRIDFLYHHFGFCRRLIHGQAKLCGILTPQPDTPDDIWNEEAFDAFMFNAQSPEIFDQGAHFDFFGAQYQINVNRFKAGRSLAVLTETQSGRASHAFYEAHQIDSGVTGQENETVLHGVQLNQFSRHLAYYLRNGGNPDEPYKRVDAEDCLYFGKFDNHGQVHPMSTLAFAVANMVDVVEVQGYWKGAIKSTASRAEVIETEAQVRVPAGSNGLGALVPVEMTLPDGTKQVVERRLMFGGGKDIAALPPGQKLRVVTDDRPTAQNLEFRRELMDDCVLGNDLPPAALFHIAGITGPGVRFVMEDIDRWILLQHRWQARKCHAIYTRTLAKEIKAGRLRDPGLEWWRPQYTHWFGLPSMTIDRGRDSRMSVVRLEVGMATWADEHAKEGAFWKKKLNHRVLEIAHVKRKVWQENNKLREETNGEIGLTYEEVIKRPNTSLLISPESENAPAPDPDTP